MQVRLARLEGEVSSLKTLSAAILAIMLGGFAFLGVQVTRMDNRINTVASDVQALPGKINGDLLNLTRTLADAITAAKQTPPQVLLVPTPLPQPAPSSR
jgi:outer membrane murein-binding lipoprotein Lpp